MAKRVHGSEGAAPPSEGAGHPSDGAAGLSPARRDLALDLVAALYPAETAVALRARDRGAWRDPALRRAAVLAHPRLLTLLLRRGETDAVLELLA
jgi:hypothetical protein